MERLSNLSRNKGATRKKKNLGRGNGSGHGSYSTRGGKGQTARTGGGTKPGFQGGQTPLYRKMPKLKGFLNVNRVSFQVVNVGDLNIFEEGEEIDVIKLFEKKLITSKTKPVKILGDGELTKKFTIKVDQASASAKAKIEKSKGTLKELLEKSVKKEPKNAEKKTKTKSEE